MGFELNGAQHITSSDHHGEYRGCRQRQRLLSISKRAAPPGWVVYAHLLLLRDSGEAGKEDAPGSCAVGLLCVAKIVRQNYSRVEIEISLSKLKSRCRGVLTITRWAGRISVRNLRWRSWRLVVMGSTGSPATLCSRSKSISRAAEEAIESETHGFVQACPR